MKARGLLIAVVALAGLSGLVYWSNKREAARSGEPDPDAPPKLVETNAEGIVCLEIRKGPQAPVVLEKADAGEWRITAPREWKADQTAATSLVAAFASLSSDRLVEENATDLAPFGLDEGYLELTATRKEGGPIRLMVGDETPTGGNFFARVEGDPRLFTVASYKRSNLDKSAWDLRDKRLVTFDSATLTRVELTARAQTLEFGRNSQGQWQILKPRPLRADGGNVEMLLGRVRDARMETEPSEEEAKRLLGEFSRAKPVAVVRLSDTAGTHELEVRRSAGEDYYARGSDAEGIHTLEAATGEGFDKGLVDFRNKKLFDFGYSDPERIEVRDAGQTAVYEKSGDQWMKDGKQMDSLQVRSLIDALRDLSAAAFPESGFTQPALEVKITWQAGSRNETVQFSQTGEHFYARREGEPPVYELTSADVDSVQKAARDIKEAQQGGN